ncbi:diphthine--ammonia ligase [Bacillus sp. BHET2]|uniref:Dph6-related ATP pyrophosphatase n=1 Tax=Bacillus sp. BHET2 TaxID=2583818 RepID=UPI00110D37DE|nr:diphthine--ammonia ligase [Bacillus sp. BHET2]TMU83997.1 diphthine--ammonia ligase [Bacillus sp. BHET2]
MNKICLSWSGGRDSMMMLHELKKKENVQGLLTTFLKESEKMMMHEVPVSLVSKQAQALGLPLYPVWFEDTLNNKDYENVMMNALGKLRKEQFTHIGFGDLYLEDIRKYREEQMKKTELELLFPLWGKDTRVLSNEFINEGYRAVIVCVDEEQLDPRFLGRVYNEEFLRDLPDSVDPCGENGEFHSFVFDGPLFREPVPYTIDGSYRKWDRFSYVKFI